MKPSVSVITLGVDDLERAVAFYRDGLGWPTQGIVGREFEHGAVAFFTLNTGLKLALWPRKSLEHDSGVGAQPRSVSEVLLSHNVEAHDHVQRVLDEAVRAGGRLVKPAQTAFYGAHAGYFQDPDGHLWEVVYNPRFQSL